MLVGEMVALLAAAKAMYPYQPQRALDTLCQQFVGVPHAETVAAFEEFTAAQQREAQTT